ncbi:MAG: trigger factor [Bacteroidales bacterium]|nr:trigger factor [Bacteroidales bacterium]
MNIVKEETGNLTAVVKVGVTKADYTENVEKTLREYRRKANLKGFRPGMAPFSLIKKMFGNQVKLDEINKIISENLFKYLRDENTEILGEPIPLPDTEKSQDFETREDFTFSFEIGLSPEIEINLSKKDKVFFHEIEINQKIRDEYVNNYRRRYGKFVTADISDEKDILKGKIGPVVTEVSKTPEGFSNEKATLAISIIKDEEIRNLFIGRKAGDVIEFDLKKAFPNDYEISGLLGISREKAAEVSGMFAFTISEVSRFEMADAYQELFNNVYGENVVTSEEEFHSKIDEEISANLAGESNYKLKLDLKKLALDKITFDLPDEFLKKWLLKADEKANAEEIEKEYPAFRENLRWQLIRKKIARENDIKVTEEELLKEAENITRYQFHQYGLFYATDEQITNYAREMIRKEDDARSIADRILDEKAIEKIKEMVTIENKKVTDEEFDALFK